MMLKVTPTAALFLKKPEEVAPAVEVAAIVRVEPVEVGEKLPNPDVKVFAVLINDVVGLATLDTTPTPTDELTNYQLLYNDTIKGGRHT
jgi:hypothetical protein